MRFLDRFGLGLLGTALVASTSTVATAQVAYAPRPAIGLEQARPGEMQPAAPAPSPAAAGHTHKGLLGWRSCVECQRARAKARDGVDVPPPPSAVPGGRVVNLPGGGQVHLAPGEVLASEPVVMDSAQAPGRAVVGGGMEMAGMAPGHAVVGGPDPAPVGVSRAAQGNFTPTNMASAPGPRDPSVMPTSMIPPQTAIGGPTGRRPRIIRHLFDLPELPHRRQMMEEKERDAHASISYDAQSGPVSELPSSVVFGKGGR